MKKYLPAVLFVAILITCDTSSPLAAAQGLPSEIEVAQPHPAAAAGSDLRAARIAAAGPAGAREDWQRFSGWQNIDWQYEPLGPAWGRIRNERYVQKTCQGESSS